MNTQNQYPMRIEKFQEKNVTVHEIEGQNFIAGEDVGRMLGLADPRGGVNRIYLRNKEELKPYQAEVKMTTPSSAPDGRGGGSQRVRVYNEAGGFLICMFAKTPRAKEVRRWLAHLPKVRSPRQKDFKDLLEEGRELGWQEALRFTEALARTKFSMAKVSRLVWLRQQGLTQTEVGAVLGIKREGVQYIEKQLKPLGLDIRPVRKGALKKEMVKTFFQQLPGAGVGRGGD